MRSSKKNKRKMNGSWQSSANSKKRQKINDAINNDRRLWTDGESCFKWLISSNSTKSDIELKDFLGNFWCQRPYLMKRNDANYYASKGIEIDLSTVYKIIEQNKGHFTFGQHVICKYFDKETQKETTVCERGQIINLAQIKSLFNDKANGATIQLLHSHFYHFEIGALIFNLESFFGDFVSSNVYITPGSKQGLKPHWDDIEAFVLQIKGSKKWKLYKLKEENEQHPINESFDYLDIANNEKYEFLMECTLSPGDLLYFPRGTVHFAESAQSEQYSLHLTISSNQKNHFGEFLKKMFNKCLDQMICKNIEFRQNMPINIINCIGTNVNMQNNQIKNMQKSNLFQQKMCKLFEECKKCLFEQCDFNKLMNECMDKQSVRFLSNRYPPIKFLKPSDFIIYAKKENEQNKKNVVEPAMIAKDELIEFIEDNNQRNVIISKESMVRMVNPEWMRCVDVNINGMDSDNEIEAFLRDEDESEQSGNLLVYSCVRNDHKTHLMAYKEDTSSQPMMATKKDKILFSVLNKVYPKWIKVRDLAQKCKEIDMKRIVDLLFALWAEGLLETDKHH